MSLDTIQRVNAYFKSAIADTYGYYTNYDNENKDLPESNVALGLSRTISRIRPLRET